MKKLLWLSLSLLQALSLVGITQRQAEGQGHQPQLQVAPVTPPALDEAAQQRYWEEQDRQRELLWAQQEARTQAEYTQNKAVYDGIFTALSQLSQNPAARSHLVKSAQELINILKLTEAQKAKLMELGQAMVQSAVLYEKMSKSAGFDATLAQQMNDQRDKITQLMRPFDKSSAQINMQNFIESVINIGIEALKNSSAQK